MKVRPFALIVLFTLFLASCSSVKTSLPYFADISEIEEGVIPSVDYLPLIEPDDELYISVKSITPSAAAPFNVPFENAVMSDDLSYSYTKNPSVRVPTYRVDSQGDILFPVLGKIHVAGLSTEQLQAELIKKISADVEDPIVTVQIVNFQVYVAGEVATPSAIKVTRNRFSVLDALASAGDLTPYGERENVLVIREEGGKRTYAHLNLNSSDVLTSPYFYLKQNDYVYVQPNSIRQSNAKYDQNNSYKLSVVSTVVSAVSIIASLVIALTVK